MLFSGQGIRSATESQVPQEATAVAAEPDLSLRDGLKWPAILLAAMLVSAGIISSFTHVDGSKVFFPYLWAWMAITLLAALVRIFVEVAKLMPSRADYPVRSAMRMVARQRGQFVIPALVFPLFIGAYTWAKTSIPLVVGYPWEAFWADADHLIFGRDPWRVAHAALGLSWAGGWTFFYAVIWGGALAGVGSVISAFATQRFVSTFFTAMMLSWFVGGFLLAYGLSAAGPIFAHVADPDLAARFAPLRAELIGALGRDDIVMTSQRYLEASIGAHVALKGGGVSAMPSMHIATATVFVMAARGTRWLPLAAGFLILTFVGSVYLGYHYAVDAPVAALVAVVCWLAAARLNRRSVTLRSAAA